MSPLGEVIGVGIIGKGILTNKEGERHEDAQGDTGDDAAEDDERVSSGITDDLCV